jgi:hypothetical protein
LGKILILVETKGSHRQSKHPRIPERLWGQVLNYKILEGGRLGPGLAITHFIKQERVSSIKRKMRDAVLGR